MTKDLAAAQKHLPQGTHGRPATMDEVLDNFIASQHAVKSIFVTNNINPVIIPDAPFSQPVVFNLKGQTTCTHDSKDTKTFTVAELTRMFGSAHASALVLKTEIDHKSMGMSYLSTGPDGFDGLSSSNASVYSVTHPLRTRDTIARNKDGIVHIPYNLAFMLRHHRPEAWKDMSHIINFDDYATFDAAYNQACGQSTSLLNGMPSSDFALAALPAPREPANLVELKKNIDAAIADLPENMDRLRERIRKDETGATICSELYAIVEPFHTAFIAFNTLLHRDAIHHPQEFDQFAAELRGEGKVKKENQLADMGWVARVASLFGRAAENTIEEQRDPKSRIEELTQKAHRLTHMAQQRVVSLQCFSEVQDTLTSGMDAAVSQLEGLVETSIPNRESEIYQVSLSQIARLRMEQKQMEISAVDLPSYVRSVITCESALGASTTALVGVMGQVTRLTHQQGLIGAQTLENQTTALLTYAESQGQDILAALDGYKQATVNMIEASSVPVPTFNAEKLTA